VKPVFDLAPLPEPTGRPGPPLQHGRRSPAANALQELIVFLYPVALAIVLTPVILNFIGEEQYGIFALATVLAGFFSVLELEESPWPSTLLRLMAVRGLPGHGRSPDSSDRVAGQDL
jgi:hypothetical protein